MIARPDQPIDVQSDSSKRVPGAEDDAAQPMVVTDTQRNGSIAGIAILLGFSLSFTATWSQGDDPWEYRGLVVLAIAAVGIALQLGALFKVLTLPVLPLDKHGKAIAMFFNGVAAVLMGYVVHIILDAAIDLGYFSN